MVLKLFPESKILTPEEAQSIHSQINKEPEVQVKKVKRQPAKPGLGGGARLRRRSRRHEKPDNYDFFDKLFPEGSNDYQTPCKGEEKKVCNE